MRLSPSHVIFIGNVDIMLLIEAYLIKSFKALLTSNPKSFELMGWDLKHSTKREH